MANDLTNNPWVVDTAAATVLSADRLRLVTIRWVGATDAGHTAVVTNAAGKVVWAGNAGSADHSEESQLPGYRTKGLDTVGLVVPTLGSGKLYITLA